MEIIFGNKNLANLVQTGFNRKYPLPAKVVGKLTKTLSLMETFNFITDFGNFPDLILNELEIYFR